MERAAFLIETSGTRIGCLLNPSTIEIKRLAGVSRRSTANGPLTGSELSDDPLLYTGGGSTELILGLLFDVTLAGSTIKTNDVRSLTGPLWDLAENQFGEKGPVRPPIVRFIWGKHWNIPGVVTAISQRLEFFAEDGAPRRSWVRLRMLRASEPAVPVQPRAVGASPLELLPASPGEGSPPELAIEAVGGSDTTAGAQESPAPEHTGVRLDQIAHEHLGDSSLWRLIAVFNGIQDPLRMAAGTLLRIPRIFTGGAP